MMDHAAGHELTSVGIDIGTTTTQLVVSRLQLGSTAPDATDAGVTDREVIHRGTVRETPLVDRTTVDTEAVRTYVTDELRAAGLSPEGIDTGAVIVTGETADTDNAEALVHQLAADVGNFVIATAGPALEAILAGKGSGAADHARRTGTTVANADIGGGTTNIGIFTGDATVETRCLDVGGRLVRFDDDGAVTGISDPAALLVDHHDLDVEVGAVPENDDLKTLVDAMADAVLDVVSGPPLDALTRSLVIGADPVAERPIDKIVFSGGVGRLLYEHDGPRRAVSPFFNDLGPLLATAIRERTRRGSIPVEHPAEDINATVIGAGTRTTEVSGTTIDAADAQLPLRNVPIVESPALHAASTVEEMATQLRETVTQAQQLYEDDGQPFALFIPAVGPLSFERISMLARAFGCVYRRQYRPGQPLIVVTEQNCAKILGQRIDAVAEPAIPLVIVDEISPTDGDYFDVGEPLFDGQAVPVVIKSLVFRG